MRFRKPHTCVVCRWTGPRRQMMRWGERFTCRDDSACQGRHALRVAAMSNAEYFADILARLPEEMRADAVQVKEMG